MKSVLLSITLSFGVSLAAVADDQPAPEAPSFTLPSIEEKYAAESSKADATVAKAEAEAMKSKRIANEARLKAYRDKLVEVTKTGDFDKAQQVKARIGQIESESENEGPAKPEKPSKKSRPKDTVKFGGHTYALIKEPATWHIAKQRCEEMGGHLVCIESPQELEFVLGLTKINQVEAWLGGSDEESEGEWKWVTGQPIAKPMSSTFRIDNHQESQHALVAGASHNVDDNCAALRRQFICEWEK